MINEMWMMAALSVFYDFSAAVVSIVDVTTDVLVTKEFYEQDKMFFFIFSVVIMVIAVKYWNFFPHQIFFF